MWTLRTHEVHICTMTAAELGEEALSTSDYKQDQNLKKNNQREKGLKTDPIYLSICTAFSFSNFDVIPLAQAIHLKAPFDGYLL